jgi:hypothetical protein
MRATNRKKIAVSLRALPGLVLTRVPASAQSGADAIRAHVEAARIVAEECARAGELRAEQKE